MPAKSKAQFRMMKGICAGSIKPKGTLTREQACEFVRGQKAKGLPGRKAKR